MRIQSIALALALYGMAEAQLVCDELKEMYQTSSDDKYAYYTTNKTCCGNDGSDVSIDVLSKLVEVTGWEHGRYTWNLAGAENAAKGCVGAVSHSIRVGDPVQLDELLTMRRMGYRANRPGWLGSISSIFGGGFANGYVVDAEDNTTHVWTAPTPETECEEDVDTANTEGTKCEKMATVPSECYKAKAGLWADGTTSNAKKCQTTCSEAARCTRVHTRAIDKPTSTWKSVTINLDTRHVTDAMITDQNGYKVPFGGPRDTISIIGMLSQNWCTYCAYWCASTSDGSLNMLTDPDGDGIYSLTVRRPPLNFGFGPMPYEFDFMFDTLDGGREGSVQWDGNERFGMAVKLGLIPANTTDFQSDEVQAALQPLTRTVSVGTEDVTLDLKLFEIGSYKLS